MILLDMDGVLTNFVKQALPLFGKSNDYPITNPSMEISLGISSEEFWQTINNAGEEFWATMPETKYCNDLLELVETTKHDWLISTSPSQSTYAASGKMMWLQNKFGKSFNRFMIGNKKYFMAKSDTVLIDDFDKNVSRFMDHGGDGILYPATYNKLSHIVDEPLGYIHSALREYGYL